jgi:NADP-dependent 3-hydroxy acid dehydrogenase YdfG
MKDEKKVVVVTGATGVLGNLVAKTFADGGHNLALLAKDQNKLDSLTRDLNLPSMPKPLTCSTGQRFTPQPGLLSPNSAASTP